MRDLDRLFFVLFIVSIKNIDELLCLFAFRCTRYLCVSYHVKDQNRSACEWK